MRDSLLFRLGGWIHRFRWTVIGVSVFVIVACVPFLPHIMTPFQTTGFVDESSKSFAAQRYLDEHLGYHHNNQFVIMYQSSQLKATDPAFIAKIKRSMSNLSTFPIKHDIFLPDVNPKQISKDKHTAYAVVVVHQRQPLSPHALKTFQSLIEKPTHMTLLIGGESLFIAGVNKQTQKDLYKADAIVAPLAIVVLIFVFGSMVAALVPLCLGGGCALIILTALYGLGHAFTLSIFTLNIALLLGLCLSLDYALFMINRFREELNQEGSNTQDAISMMLATAGRAVLISGVAVFISLSALLFFPINILFSIGVGGLTATFMAVVVALFLLPAVLAVLNGRVKPQHASTPRVWRVIALEVIKRPVAFFLTSLMLLFFLSAPFLVVQFGISDYHILPKHSESRQFFDVYEDKFNAQELAPIEMILSVDRGNILSAHAVSALYDLATRLKKNPRIKDVNSIVTTVPRLTKMQYQSMYSASNRSNPAIAALLKTTTRDDFTVFRVESKTSANSPQTKALILQLSRLHLGEGLTLRLTGTPVINADVYHTIARIFPYAMLWIMGLTYGILLVVFRSIFLPLKAIFMNVLSLTASYGVLVYVFQEGHLHQWLHFEPQGMLDMSLLIIVFCAIFGFSMDYEVFLLTRIQESYRKTKDNNQSIVFGIEQSSRIITSAALIVICICGSFMVADVLMVKEFGLGIAVAIGVDAFIIRSLFVPSTMVLIKDWNWYLPRWLRKLLPEKKR
jgi:RND superfamily putative drug exporter